MKKTYLLLVALFIAMTGLFAQKDYNVVFDLTSGDTTEHQKVIRWLKGISKEVPDAKLEVVFYGSSLGMVTQNKSTVATDVMTLAKNPNIQFKVCQGAMRRHKLSATELLDGVLTVPDAIYEIITKQREGWGYIKVIQ